MKIENPEGDSVELTVQDNGFVCKHAFLPLVNVKQLMELYILFAALVYISCSCLSLLFS